VADLRAGVRERFGEIAEVLCAALRSLGVDARVGEVPGEYCPGEHSVNARGRTKLAGVGQRLVRGAAHGGGVIEVRDAESVRRALVPVYERLEVAWEPATAGAVEDEVPGVTREAVVAALLAEFGERHALARAELPAALLSAARALEHEHRL
jgi:lipoate-protein ligase A